MERFFNIDRSRSYASEANLNAALVRLFGEDLARRAFVVCNRQGRFSAVFAVSDCRPDVTLFARHGFMTMG